MNPKILYLVGKREPWGDKCLMFCTTIAQVSEYMNRIFPHIDLSIEIKRLKHEHRPILINGTPPVFARVVRKFE